MTSPYPNSRHLATEGMDDTISPLTSPVSSCITEMTLSGELDQLFDKHGVSYDKSAAEQIRAQNS